jgi:hypothetical protein
MCNRPAGPSGRAAFLLGGLLGGLALGLAIGAVPGRAQEAAPGAVDTRERILLPAPARNMVLAEMRQMLISMEGVLTGLAQGNPALAAEAARASGVAAAVDVAPEIAARLPEAFIQLGMATHQGYDDLAESLQAGAAQQEVLAAFAELTQNCVACHATYRIDEAP